MPRLVSREHSRDQPLTPEKMRLPVAWAVSWQVHRRGKKTAKLLLPGAGTTVVAVRP